MSTIKRQYSLRGSAKESNKRKSVTHIKKSISIGKVAKQSFNWGPYLAERQWATIREDCSTDGSCWEYCTYESSLANPYISGEDGLMGVSDDACRLCMSWGFWNGHDKHVKEKLFGLKGGLYAEGNHGEDVKEVYFYQANTPSHDFMQMKYMYPCVGFPYDKLREVNVNRSVFEDEFELWDTEVFHHGHWELQIEYVKPNEADISAKLTATNCSSIKQVLHILPTVWFRNTWNSIYQTCKKHVSIPNIHKVSNSTVSCHHKDMGSVFVHFQPSNCKDARIKHIYFTNNEKEQKNLISQRVVTKTGMLPDHGTKCSGEYIITCNPNQSKSVWVLLSSRHHTGVVREIDQWLISKRMEAHQYYNGLLHWIPSSDDEMRQVAMLAYSGLLWNKQFYLYNVRTHSVARDKLHGSGQYFKWNPTGWDHLDNHDIMSMPDKWEFPWYASWDSCFHVSVLADIDPKFSQHQMELILGPRFMSPTGQVPGCEFNYSDENPPVYSWAVWEVYKTTKNVAFLKNVYPRLLANFQWWLNERQVKNKVSRTMYFQSGFLGMDNICALDRSQVPRGFTLYQADAYAWIFITALYCMKIAMELKKHKDMPYWIQCLARMQHGFTHFSDNFCFDILTNSEGNLEFVKIYSMVGLMPLVALDVFGDTLEKYSDSVKKHQLRMESMQGSQNHFLVSLLDNQQRIQVIQQLFSNNAFLGPFGIRMLSKAHDGNSCNVQTGDQTWSVIYEPGESRTRMYMGNSNWRGPVWLCMNYMLVQSLLKLQLYSSLPFSTGELGVITAAECAKEISRRVIGIFRENTDGCRAVHGSNKLFGRGGPWSSPEYVLFYEYFHGDTGRGCGANHQTGWTSMIVKFLEVYYWKDNDII